MLLKWLCECGYQFEKDSTIIDPMCPICSSKKVYDGNDTFRMPRQKPMAKVDPFDALNDELMSKRDLMVHRRGARISKIVGTRINLIRNNKN